MSDLAPSHPPAPTNGNGRGGGGSGGFERVPPHSLEAEVSVLGSAMLSPDAVGDVLELLSPEDFYRNAHRAVFEAIRDLANDHVEVDAVTVLDWLRTNSRLDEV
ncbi:MAG: DnaB-like helicase N-terminal domain-containing protein, partial [Nitriliruptorales bacterium]|nr:DnaB-like helicase N-terminal domain-containing protein [Nitriliruptorales bacterium]